MPEIGLLISEDFAARTAACVRDFERNVPLRDETLPNPYRMRPPLRGILLQDLDDEGQAVCAVTVRDTTRLVQKLTVVGEITSAGPAGGTFILGINGTTQVTPALSVYSTAAQVAAALGALSSIGAANISVTLGQIPAQPATPTQDATPAYFPGVWLIEFIGKYLQPNSPPAMPLLTVNPSITGLTYAQIETTVWADTGTQETVNALIPISAPTPMRSGAVVAAVWWPGLGFSVLAAEGREFSAIGPGG